MVVLRRKTDDAAPASKVTANKVAPTASAAPDDAEHADGNSTDANKATPPKRPANKAPTTLDEADIPIEVEQPEAPLSIEQQRKYTVDQLEKIGIAIDAYVAQNGQYPPPAIYDSAGNPLLSWRVALLPYLGYEPLYEMFRLDEPWDSRHNRKLLPAIPKVYASPRRFNDKTNYCVPIGNSTLFQGERGVAPRKVDDGEKNTVMVIETNDALAVTWTAPVDYDYDANSPTRGLGGNYPDGFLVVWGGGRVSRLNRVIPLRTAQAMYSIAGGESFTSQTVHNSPLTLTNVATAGASPDTAPTVATGAASTANPAVAAPTAGTASVAPTTASSEQAATFLKAAQVCWKSAFERAGFNYLYASQLTADAPHRAKLDMQWSPALRRPAVAIRFAVGIEYVGPRISGSQTLVSIPTGQRDRLSDLARESDQVVEVGGELAQAVLVALASHVEQGHSGELLQKQTHPESRPDAGSTVPTPGAEPVGRWLYPGIAYLGPGSRRDLLQLARREAVDVLVVLEVEVTPIRGGSYNHTARARLVDVQSANDLFRTTTINDRRLKIARQDRLEADPLEDASSLLHDFLEKELVLVDMPDGLRASHVAQRVAVLTAEQHENPLPVMVEIKMYSEHGLLPYDQLAAAFRAVIGPSNGDVLAGGSADRRAEVLGQWLPREMPDLSQLDESRTAAKQNGRQLRFNSDD